MGKDKVFEKKKKISDFKFGAEVVQAFDDMVNRSVPYYGEIQRMIAEMGKTYAKAGTRVYDLGCSTGASILQLNDSIQEKIKFIGLDDSSEMLERCAKKLEERGLSQEYELLHADLNKAVEIENASLVNVCLTLQFIRPQNRLRLLRSIYEGLNPGGCLILTEKVLGADSEFNRQFIKYYYDMKRRHEYSETEIAQKREALENVLIPFSLEENMDLLREAGFEKQDVFFKWYNFTGIVAIK